MVLKSGWFEEEGFYRLYIQNSKIAEVQILKTVDVGNVGYYWRAEDRDGSLWVCKTDNWESAGITGNLDEAKEAAEADALRIMRASIRKLELRKDFVNEEKEEEKKEEARETIDTPDGKIIVLFPKKSTDTASQGEK